MKKVAIVARILLGLIFFVFGLNGFLNFIPLPPAPEPAQKFLMALAETGYMFPLIKTIEVITGLFILINFQVPFALLLLAPIAINIFLFHLFLEGVSTILMPAIILICIGITAYDRFEHYKNIFIKKL
jgi:uncharacterized membrane protein YphA (DoxX/SURF4 family)